MQCGTLTKCLKYEEHLWWAAKRALALILRGTHTHMHCRLRPWLLAGCSGKCTAGQAKQGWSGRQSILVSIDTLRERR